MCSNFAEVIVDIRNRKVDKSFHYSIPKGLDVQLGSRVIVPFNRRTVEGIVIGFSASSPVATVKPIINRVSGDIYLNPELIELARWMADYYICPFIQALRCILPAPMSVKQEIIVQAVVPPDDPDVQALSLLDPEAGKVFTAVCKAKRPVKLANLTKRLGKQITPQIEDLIARGIIVLSSQFKTRSFSMAPSSGECQDSKKEEFVLTSAQQRALKTILAGLHEWGTSLLLHGVTGSGKTEVYLQAVKRVLQDGHGALVLVPEISLTPQIYSAFVKAFPGQVAVLHSAMGDAERAREYQRIHTGEARIVVGARSAVFAPVKDLGLIIIDEEHEPTYKQEENPKYHVREVAQKRAELCGCSVVLGSATPSLESYALAVTGKHKLVSMDERVGNRPLPSVEIVDLREELVQGNAGIFSRSLAEKMRNRVERGEQVILFLNRRGFSTFIVCRECGYVAKCPHCDITLTYHLATNKLKCHYCDYTVAVPQTCPGCNSRQIKYFGLGTERVEQEISKLFPNVGVLRMDADSTGRQGSHQEILNSFKSGDAQVLIGTQMIAKGLDFPRVTLVGVISGDSTLNMPDFRARERTFQLLTQVAGRAGRGNLPGEVIVQTFSPEDPGIICAQQHNYKRFFQEEIKFRQALGYPPFSHLLRVVLAGEDENCLIKCAQDLGGLLRQEVALVNQKQKHPIEILGPAPSPISKLKNRYRWQVIIKGKRVEDLKLATGKAIRKLYQYSSTARISLSLDLDPMGMV